MSTETSVETGYTIRFVREGDPGYYGLPGTADPECEQYVLEFDGEFRLDLGTDLNQAKLDAEGHLTDATWDAEWTVEYRGTADEVWTLVKHFGGAQ